MSALLSQLVGEGLAALLFLQIFSFSEMFLTIGYLKEFRRLYIMEEQALLL
jgi:hypothetical protein